MNFAFILRSKAVSSLQSWANRMMSADRVCRAPLPYSADGWDVAPSTRRPVTPVVQTCVQIRRPLRVVRVVESGQPRAYVGRMVISGRMADVCAELDRLAAWEAAENFSPRVVAAMSC